MALALFVIKATALFLAAMSVALLYRRAPDRRHQAWTIAFGVLLAFPLLTAVLPPLDVRVPNPWPAGRLADVPATRSGSTPQTGPIDSRASTAAARTAPWPSEARGQRSLNAGLTAPTTMSLAAGLWLGGTAYALAMISLALWRVRRLAASAEEILDTGWRLSAAEIGARLGLRRSVRLLRSAEIDTPMAGGFRRPAVFLPMSASDWGADCRDAVLTHELVHLVRHDPLRHLVVRLTLALYWFHPAAWVAARSAALACEDACDEAVVQAGIRPSAYARVLLELAESAGRPSRRLAALPIVQPSRLERRLTMILGSEPKLRSPRRLPLAAVGCAVVAVGVAAARPAASVTASRAASLVAVCQSDWVEGASLGSDRMEVRERVGGRGYTRVILKRFGDLRLCLFAEDAGEAKAPSQIAGQAGRVLLEAWHADTLQQFEMTRPLAESSQAAWRVNGIDRPVDSAAHEWRRHMLSVLDTTWELAMLRGEGETPPRYERDRRARALELRRAGELAQLRRNVDATARQADPGSELAAHRTLAEMPEIPSTAVQTPSACDLAASWAAFERGGSRSTGQLPRFLHETFDDLRICLRVDEGNVFETVRPSELMRRARYAVIEAQRNGLVHRLALTRAPGGTLRADWRVNGVSRAVDTAVEAWQNHIVDVLDTSWEIFALRGAEGELLGKLSLAGGERRGPNADRTVASLRAQIASLKVDQRTAEWNSLRTGQVERFRAAMAAIH